MKIFLWLLGSAGNAFVFIKMLFFPWPVPVPTPVHYGVVYLVVMTLFLLFACYFLAKAVGESNNFTLNNYH